MKRNFLYCLLVTLGITLPCEGGMFKNLSRPVQPWHFDGRAFAPGTGDGNLVVLVRDGYLPVVQTRNDSKPGSSLPEGQGVVAGLCYVQVAGGKLANRSVTVPTAGYPLEIVGATGTGWRVTTGDNGFFTAPLPPGTYEVRGSGMPVKVTVTAGKTSLVALRTGKRMAD